MFFSFRKFIYLIFFFSVLSRENIRSKHYIVHNNNVYVNFFFFFFVFAAFYKNSFRQRGILFLSKM